MSCRGVTNAVSQGVRAMANVIMVLANTLSAASNQFGQHLVAGTSVRAGIGPIDLTSMIVVQCSLPSFWRVLWASSCHPGPRRPSSPPSLEHPVRVPRCGFHRRHHAHLRLGAADLPDRPRELHLLPGG